MDIAFMLVVLVLSGLALFTVKGDLEKIKNLPNYYLHSYKEFIGIDLSNILNEVYIFRKGTLIDPRIIWMIIFSLIVVLMSFLSGLIFYDKCPVDILVVNVIWFLAVVIFSAVIILFVFGIFLTILTGIIELITEIRNNAIFGQTLMSFLLLSMELMFVLGQAEIVQKNIYLILILILGNLISYFLIFRVMLQIVMNPYCITDESKQPVCDDSRSYGKNTVRNKRVFITAISILLIVLMIISLYIFVLLSHYKNGGAYVSAYEGELDGMKLLYYTIISFTTIGYGDISPATHFSQMVSILISFSSVFCLIVFVSSLLSIKDEYVPKKE